MLFIDDLLLSPISGFKFILRTLVKTAEEQWNDDAPLKERLMELQVALDQGDLTEDQYAEQEAEILQALRDIQQRKMEAAGFNPDEAPTEGLSGSGVTGSVEANFGWGPSSDNDRKK